MVVVVVVVVACLLGLQRGVAVGAMIAVILIALAAFFFWRRRKRAKATPGRDYSIPAEFIPEGYWPQSPGPKQELSAAPTIYEMPEESMRQTPVEMSAIAAHSGRQI